MYVPILIDDIVNLKTMPSDIYIFLPLNGKYLKFLKQGVPPSKLDTLISKNVDKVFIEYNDLRTFLSNRETWGTPESQEFSLIAKSGEETVRNKIMEIVNRQINNERPADFSLLNYFITDILNITVPGEDSILFYALSHLNLGKDIPHSQMVAIVSIIAATSKKLPVASLPSLALAALYHEIPFVIRQDYNTYVDQYKPGSLSEESLEFYRQMGVCSNAMKLAANYQNGERDDILCKTIFEADTIVHSGDYTNIRLIGGSF
jgi:hypothetical protein